MAAAAVRALEWAGVSEEQPRPGCSAPQTGTVRTTDDLVLLIGKICRVGSACRERPIRPTGRRGTIEFSGIEAQ
jgi:hypothetical protein